MNKKELGDWIRTKAQYVTKDGKFKAVIIEAHDWYVLLSELGLRMAGKESDEVRKREE